ACKAGDLPLIYRPRRAHSVAAQMKLSATFRRSDRDAYPITRDEGGMGPGAVRLVRWFVGLSLLAGGLVLLAGAVQFGTLGGPIALVLATQLAPASVVAGFVLFLLDSIALLAIHRSYFEPR